MGDCPDDLFGTDDEHSADKNLRPEQYTGHRGDAGNHQPTRQRLPRAHYEGIDEKQGLHVCGSELPRSTLRRPLSKER